MVKIHATQNGDPWERLSDDQLKEYGDMLAVGKSPTIGWWQRTLAESDETST